MKIDKQQGYGLSIDELLLNFINSYRDNSGEFLDSDILRKIFQPGASTAPISPI